MLEAVSDAEESSKDRKNSEDHERTEHYPRTLVRPSVAVRVVTMRIISMRIMTVRFLHCRAAIIATEGHVHQAEHIKGSDESSDHADQPVDPACAKGLPENFVFGPEAGQRRNAGD